MNIHNEVPVLILHVLEADIPKDASVVDQNIDTPEALDSGLDDLLAMCNAVIVGYSFAPCSSDFIHNNIGSLYLGLAKLAILSWRSDRVKGGQSFQDAWRNKTYPCGIALSFE